MVNFPWRDAAKVVPVPPSIRPIHSRPCPDFWRIQWRYVRETPVTWQDSVTGSPCLLTTDSEEVSCWPRAAEEGNKTQQNLDEERLDDFSAHTSWFSSVLPIGQSRVKLTWKKGHEEQTIWDFHGGSVADPGQWKTDANGLVWEIYVRVKWEETVNLFVYSFESQGALRRNM